MQLIKNNLYIDYRELISSKIISEAYLKKGLQRQREGVVNCWQHKRYAYINNTWKEYSTKSRKGSVYIYYDTLRPKYKEEIKEIICDGADPYLYTKNQLKKQKDIQQQKTTSSLSDKIEINTEQLEYFKSITRYNTSECHQLARAAAWLSLLNTINAKKAHALGYDSVQQLRANALDIINKEIDKHHVRFKNKRISNVQVLYRYMTAYKNHGCKSLVSQKYGNQNRRKINKEQHAWLMAEMSKPTKPSYCDVAMSYNLHIAPQEGWPELTISAIREHLSQPKYKRVWYFSRHGRDAANNEYQSQIKRRRVSFPDALISLDGTAMQLYYLDDNGKIKSDLYYYLTVDVYSLAVVGWSVAFTETSEMVKEALKMYIDKGYKPHQLQYDNSSANVSTTIRAIMSNMAKVAFPCKPYSGRSKVIEPVIGHFEQRVLRHFENFKGGSPRTTSLDSKANPELLKKIKKDIPTQQQVIEQFKQAVDEWNARGEQRNNLGVFEGKSKIEKYNEPHEQRISLSYFDRLSLFMVELDRSYEYRKQGIKLRVNGKDRNYIVPDPDNIGDFIFQNQYYGKEFKIRINTLEPHCICLYRNGKYIAEAFEKEEYAACVADMQKGEAAKIKTYQLKQKQYGEEQAHKELERQRHILQQIGLPTGTEGAGFSWQDMPKHNLNIKENEEVDVQNDIQQDESELIRRLKDFG